MAKQPADSGTTRPGPGRMLSFVDAVVAIAMTLLILPLVSDAATTDRPPEAFLRDNSFSIFAFVLSFVVIFRFWLGHHRIYERVSGFTPAMVWANLVWLLSLVFLPFPTQLLANGGTVANGLYIGTMLLTSTSAMLQVLIIRRTPGLTTGPGPDPRPVLPAATRTILMALALVVALGFPGVGLWALLLLFLQGPASRLAAMALRSA